MNIFSSRILNFDYLRLALASTVALNHIGASGIHSPLWNSELSVLFFFCISGFLITQSYMNSANFSAYFKKRMLRIYPPILLITSILIAYGFFIDGDAGFFRGVLSLPLFQDWLVLSKDAANLGVYGHGAFWTLVVEFQFYLFLPLVVESLRKREKTTLLVLTLLYFAAHFYRRYIPETVPLLAYRESVFVFAHFFIAGILMAYYSKSSIVNGSLFWVALPVFAGIYLFVSIVGSQVLTHLFPFAMIWLVLAAAKVLGNIGNKAPWGDLSYGIYLYHLPVNTILRHYGVEAWEWVFLTTVILSFLSWHLLEKRCLKYAHNKVTAPIDRQDSTLAS